MNKLHFVVLGFVLSCLDTHAAQASVFYFDDVTEDSEATIADGYGGLNWSNFWVQNPVLGQVTDLDSGFYNGMVSEGYTAFNGLGGAAEISSDSPFDFNSAYFSSAYRWGLEITVTGFLNSSQVYQQKTVVNTDSAQLFTLNFVGIDRLVLSSTGGDVYLGSGYHFTMDNASINTAPVPVPAAVWLFGSAIFGLAGIARRKKAA